jgi:U3 small nucleolar RNA-associated protein 10
VNTPAFFNALQNHVVRVMEAGHQSSSLLSFWSIVTTEAIAGILNQTSSGQRGVQDQKTEELLLRVLPVLNACMRSGNGAEAVTACYTIVIVLASEASFEDKILDTLMEAAIISYGDETLEPCLKCLAVLAEERSRVQLPRAVSRRLLRVQNLSKTLLSLSKDAKGCRIDRLALGAALGALDNLDASEESQQIFRDIVESNMLDESQLSVALSALVQVLRKSEPASPEHSHLVDFVSRLSDLPAVSRLLEAVAKKTGTNLESLGLILGSTLMDEAMPREDEDEEMPDAIDEDSISTPLVLPPEIREISFLATSFSETFQTTRAALNQAVASHRASQFLAAESLQQKKAFENPLYFSFLARVWCSQDLIATRLTALRSATALIKNNDRPTNLQNVIPSLLYALSDPSATIRQSAVACMAELSAKMEDWQKSYRGAPWGSTDLYGDDSSNISDLFSEHVSGLLSVLVPILEECAMDANVAIATLKEVLEGSQSNKASKHSLKATLRQHITSWLAGHIANTPLISVRLRLLPLVCFVGKSSAAARTDTILPMIRAWCSFPRTEVVSRCDNEQFATNDAERAHLKALVPREAESVSLLMDVISGKCSQDRPQLLDASFDWLVSNWSSMRSESRLGLSLSLLDLSLQDKNPEFDDQCTSRSLQTLRVVKLDSPSLVSLLQSVPSSAEMAEGPPTKKRRRTSRSELARAEFQSPDVARLLRRLTLVLELVEGSIPGNHPTLFKNLFTILGELQQLKQQSGSDLVYLQSLVLGSLTPIVNSIRTEKDTTEYRAAVRADLLVDCIRHSTSPQVQNAALLLISTLASWVPELILHNLMPIFTFIGSNLLRQQDDYSAHVVDQVRLQRSLIVTMLTKLDNFARCTSSCCITAIKAQKLPHRRSRSPSELHRSL